MEVSMLQLSPGDPRLIDKIICQLKSNGIFDQFRKECIADVDTKPAYQNLRQRVEGSVSSFLTNQEWRPDLNKNQLRDSLRKHIHESGFLDIGVERIVDQVVNPKMYTVFFPKVEDVVYGFLGVEKPKKGTESQNSLQIGTPKFEYVKPEKKFISLKDLLPTDLDPISPEKLDSDEDMEEVIDKDKIGVQSEVKEASIHDVKVKEEVVSDGGNEFDGEEKDEDEEDDDEASPPFESLEVEAFETNATPPILPVNSADMLDNITSSSSSSSEAKEYLHYGGEVRKQSVVDWKSPSDSVKKDVDSGGEKYSFSEPVKTEVGSCAVKKEEKEKKDVLECHKDWKKFDKREKSKDYAEKKEEGRRRKSLGAEGKEEKKERRESSEKNRRNIEREEVKQEREEVKREREEVKREREDVKREREDVKREREDVKREREDVKRSEKWMKEEQKRGEKDDHRKSEKGDYRRGEKEEMRKVEREEYKGSGKGDRKQGEKEGSRKTERDSWRKHEKGERKSREKELRDEKGSEKKYVRDKEECKRVDDVRRNEREESRRNEKSDLKKRDRREERKGERKDEGKRAEEDGRRKGDKERRREGGEKENGSKEERHGLLKPIGGERDKNDREGLVERKKEVRRTHHRDGSKLGEITKEKKVGEKEKKVRSSVDDHRQERDKGKNSHRRSDRDKDRERERPQAEAISQTQGREGSGPSSSTSSAPSSSSDGNKGNEDGSGHGSDRAKEGEPMSKTHATKTEKEPACELADLSSLIQSNLGNLVLKIKKPKIAANIYEVKKIIQVRKNLKKLERERMASSNMSKIANPEEVKEPAHVCREKTESKPVTEPPKVKRVKLGDVEQELRGEVESVLEEGLLDGEDDNLGDVCYLEENSKHTDFLIYVHSLSEKAAGGDLSRIPSPTHSMGTTDLSDFEDVVVLSDVDLSKEEEEVITKLGGQVERKTQKKLEKKSSSLSPSCSVPSSTGGEGSAKRPRRPNPKYNSGEYSIYSDEEEEEMVDKKVSVDEMDHWKTPKERTIEEDAEAVGKHIVGGSALPTPENDEDKETPVLSKKEGRRVGRRLGVRGPLRRVAGVSNPGTPDMFVMPLSPESDVSSASGDAGKKAPVNTKEGHYHSAEIDSELGSEEYDDMRGPDDGESKQPQLPLGPPSSGISRGCELRSHAGDINQSFCDSGQPSCILSDRRLDDSSVVRRLRGTRSSSRVQQRYSSDDLYKPRPNITLGRRNRGKNSPSQDDIVEESTCVKQDSRRSTEVPDVAIADGCLTSKRRRR